MGVISMGIEDDAGSETDGIKETGVFEQHYSLPKTLRLKDLEGSASL